jgi:hypothetical protein
MESKYHIWRVWAESLHNWGLHEATAALLEAAGPLALPAAQLVYLGQPLLAGLASAGKLQALVDLLEEPVNQAAFVSLLRRGDEP